MLFLFLNVIHGTLTESKGVKVFLDTPFAIVDCLHGSGVHCGITGLCIKCDWRSKLQVNGNGGDSEETMLPFSSFPLVSIVLCLTFIFI